MRTQDQENKQQIIQKYKNISFLDGEENQTDRIDPENLEGPTEGIRGIVWLGSPSIGMGIMWT